MGYVTGGGTSGSGAVSTVAGRTGDVVIAESDVTSLASDLALKAPLASPTLTGTPTLPTGTIASTQSVGDSSTKLATTAFVAANASTLAGTVGGPPKIIRRSSDSTAVTANTTLASDDTLLWAIGAADHWFFQMYLIVSAANTAMDLKVGWSVPASATMQWALIGNAAGTTNSWGAGTTATTPNFLLTAASTFGYGTGAGTSGVGIAGMVAGGGTAGNVNLQWAQNTSDAGALKLLADSCIIAWRMA